jgi:hypothetical protein
MQKKSTKKTPQRGLRETARKHLAENEEDDKSTKGASPEDDCRNRVLTRICQQSSGPFEGTKKPEREYMMKRLMMMHSLIIS